MKEDGLRRCKTPARDGRSITESLFSLRGPWQGLLANGDCLLTRVCQLVGLKPVELAIFREFRPKVLPLVHGDHRSACHACHAINAILRMNDHLVLQFVEAREAT